MERFDYVIVFIIKRMLHIWTTQSVNVNSHFGLFMVLYIIGKSRGNFQSFVGLYFSLDTDITDNFE